MGHIFSGETEIENHTHTHTHQTTTKKKNGDSLCPLEKENHTTVGRTSPRRGCNSFSHVLLPWYISFSLQPFNLPYGLTRVTVLEDSVSMLILIKSYRIDVVDHNCRRSTIESMCPDGGSRGVAQCFLESLCEQAACGIPEPSKSIKVSF